MIKDHMYGLPIRNIEFHKSMDLVYSMDSSIVKIWEQQTVSRLLLIFLKMLNEKKAISSIHCP